MMGALLGALERALPAPRVIYDRNGRTPYLSRWTLLRTRHLRVFLHRFHRGDDELELHNHPWRWAASLILAGGYLEERRGAGGAVRVKRVRVGTVNLLRANTFHRVELCSPVSWSLFIAGARVQDWGFWNRDTKVYLPWKMFISRLRDPSAYAQAEAEHG